MISHMGTYTSLHDIDTQRELADLQTHNASYEQVDGLVVSMCHATKHKLGFRPPGSKFCLHGRMSTHWLELCYSLVCCPGMVAY